MCVAGFLLSTVNARANVYATDIQINGSLYSVTNSTTNPSPVTITYRLNETADLGVTVAILQGSKTVATIVGGTKKGLNSVVWGVTNNAGGAPGSGAFLVSITAAASGFKTWTQISADTNAGNYAAAPNGLAVDNNTGSPYYGRVVVGCATEGGVNPISGTPILDGIYKMNADGSFADEGGFGYGAYTNDDAGDTSLQPGEMPSGSTVLPWRLRIGDDDRIYMLDFSDEGAIVAFDMQVTTNQVVIDEGNADSGRLGGPHNYVNNPDFSDLRFGINNFDIPSATNADASVWLCNDDTPPNWGAWLYHLVQGASDPADTKGTQSVTTGGDLSLGSTGGCMVDSNLDIFISQKVSDAGDSANRTMVFLNWQSGVLPAEASGTTYADGKTAGQVAWAVGAGDNTMTGINDTVINSRSQPTYVALPMGGGAPVSGGYNGGNSGIRVLNATNGTVVSVTNGASIQTLTNLDLANAYTCAAWDNVGNLYAASTSANLWRVWSPPGTNTNTTVAVAQVIFPGPPGALTITGITAQPTGSGCSTVTITFTASSLPATAFTLVGSSALNGTFSAVTGAAISGSAGTYQATFSNCSTQFYEIEQTGQ